MTLSTLKTMNVAVGDLGQAMKLRAPGSEAASPAPKAVRATSAADGTPAGVVDPMQWWGALTQQFTQLAVQAMKDSTTDAAKTIAGAMAKQSLDAAGRTLKKAAAVPAAIAQGAARAASSAPSPSPSPSPTPRRKRKAR
jgi:hypothetical protein